MGADCQENLPKIAGAPRLWCPVPRLCCPLMFLCGLELASNTYNNTNHKEIPWGRVGLSTTGGRQSHCHLITEAIAWCQEHLMIYLDYFLLSNDNAPCYKYCLFHSPDIRVWAGIGNNLISRACRLEISN